jgi:hypothetical protein
VFPSFELISLDLVAHGTSVRIHGKGHVHIFCCRVVLPMANRTGDFDLAMPAGFPVRHNTWSDTGVTCDAFLSSGPLLFHGVQGRCPLPESPLETVNIFEPEILEFQCRPGSC